jgi:GT2 family glycosyltransferase
VTLRERIAAKLAARRRAQHSYAEWVRRYDTLDDAKRASIRAAIEEMPRKPLFSIVVPTYETPEDVLRSMLDSVLRQLYPHWELCIADDASPNPTVKRVLSEYAAKDSRIKVVLRETNGHISEATNSALELARGEFVMFADHDDVLPEHALFMVARWVNRFPHARLFYSDEDHISPEGERTGPYFKPDWSPELALGQNLFANTGVYQAALVREVGGMRKGFEGSQDHDLVLRCVERAGDAAVVHIPHILYHWRMIPGSTARGVSEKPYALRASIRAVQEHLSRTGVRGVVTVPIEGTNMLRVRYEVPRPLPLVSIVIACSDPAEAVRCVEGIHAKTMYERYEILIVAAGSNPFAQLSPYSHVRVVRDDRPFDAGALHNRGAREAAGQFLCFFETHVRPISADWLDELVSHAVRPQCGAVGAALRYPDDRLWHGGFVIGAGDLVECMHRELPRGHAGHYGRAVLTQNVTAVSGECLVVEKSLFDRVGAFDEDLAVAFADVDFCLRVRKTGRWNVHAPNADLVRPRPGPRVPPPFRWQKDAAAMRGKWGKELLLDPFHNPNLGITIEDLFDPAFPPRIGMLD